MDPVPNPSVREGGRWPRWAIPVALVATALAGWSVFHPDFRPDVRWISPAVRQELGRTGFRSTQGVTSVRFESVELQEGVSEDAISRQKITAIDAMVTEKRSRRQMKGLTREFSGLYVGPIAVVRLMRNWPPLVGDLLPYHFWSSSRMAAFFVEQVADFPHARGGKLVARATYENHHGDGQPAPTEHVRLRCDVSKVVAAASIDSRLTGAAARIDCMGIYEVDPGEASSNSQETSVPQYARYSHWYVVDRGWSMPIEGEEGYRAGALSGVYTWRVTRVTFD